MKGKSREPFDIVALHCFVAAAEEGSFTAAGKRVGLTQQTVSYHMQRLEAEVGRPLFERRSTGLVTTDTGEGVLVHARAIVAGSQRLAQFVEVGRPLIRVSEIRSRRVMQQIWQAHMRVFPDHRVSVTDMTSDEQVRALREGGIDIAMSRITGPQPGLAHEPLLVDPVRVMYPSPIDSPRLSDPGLAYAGVPGRFLHWQGFCEQINLIDGVDLQRIPHDVTMLDAIGRGQIRGQWPPALVLEGLRDYPGTEGFEFHHLTDIQPYFPWSIVWRADETRPDVLAVIDTARQVSYAKGWMTAHPGPGEPWFSPDGEVHGFGPGASRGS